jgi:hypothetical protein
VAQFLSPPLAKAAAWASNVQFSIYLNRQEVATTNNCFVRYGVYKLSGGVATQIVTTTTSTSGESPTTAATSATNMSTSSAQTFAAGDQILVEISIAKSVPTATNTNACTVKWGATSTDQTRLTLPATTDSTFPEFTTATPLALNTTWAARSMSPFAPTAANEIITGTGTANAFQSMLWKRASFTSPPLGVAATLPSASWTLNVQDSRGGMSSSTSFLRYRIFRWNADGTQGPDIVAWRTYSTGMLSSLGLQAITVPATAVNATALAVGDRVVVEVEVETMNLTTSATGNNTIVFGSGNQSSVVMPAKVTFDYINTTQAAPATAGHLGGLYTGIHRPNPGEETLARIAAAKHVECSDCHDPHGAKRGNQADGGTATAGSATTLTDVNQSWLPGAWVGFYVDVVSGTGSGGRAQITGNTATQLTFTTLSTAPVAGSGYRVSMRANGGAVSSATSSTLTDTQNLVGGSTKAWQTNILAGWTVRIVLGTGVGQSAKVLSNTATQLTIVGTWATTPDTTSRYVVDRLPNVLTGAGGVNVTAWAAGTPSAWGEAKTIVPAPGSAVSIPDATTQWQVCFKCHSAANTAVTSWKSGWTDLASEFNPRNQSYHPIIAPAAAFAATGYGNTQLSATQLTNGWKPGDMMYCSDCHGNNDTGYGASQGPHASAVKFVLRGPNTRWPTMADNATRFTTGSSSPFTAGQGTASGLFCLNCHALSGVHTRSEHNNVACTGCHIVIPHGGKLKRLMRTSNTPSPYADVAGTVGQQVSADYPTGKAALKSYTGGVSDSSTSCGANCTTHHNLTPNTTTAPVNAW